MITVTISETNGRRKWSHSARTKDALTAIIRTMRKHFPQSHNFIPDDVDNIRMPPFLPGLQAGEERRRFSG
ncbi:hypothetical protein YM93_003245 [Salmonella enterica subsp. enterica]|nr:hypothetical protein [Salmonella enterica subsp. enterica]